MRARKPRQRTLVFRTWGGKRRGAGRKPAPGTRAGVSHRPREHQSANPAHVTVRLRDELPSLREPRLYLVVESAIRAGNDRFGFRVVEFSAPGNHLHFIVEADSAKALSRGMQGLLIRIAKAVNRALGRTGKVFKDRFHARDLRTPTETRNCLVYVLNNAKHHMLANALSRDDVDPYSSASWFSGWAGPIRSLRLEGPAPTVSPRTWLLRVGWRRRGLVRPSELPKS